MKSLNRLFISVVLSQALLFSEIAFAKNSEPSALPINVSSDRQDLDGINKVGVFIENVVVTQGDLTILADELKVLEREGKGSELFMAKGSPASFTRTLDGKKISAKAKSINYDLATKTISLEGDAELSQDGSVVRGETIAYNIETQVLSAEGNQETSERVTTIFLPDQTNDEQQAAPK